MKKFLALSVAIILSTFCLTACGNMMSNKELQKLLTDDKDLSHIDSESAKMLSEKEINDELSAIMFSAKDEDAKTACYIAVLDKEKEELSLFEPSYSPLIFMQKEISYNRPQTLNNSYFEKVSEKLIEDEYFFEDEENSKEFLREISSKGGIVSTATAQDIITEIAKTELGFENDEEFCAVFENDCAIPICYASKSVESVYCWDWLPESQYLTFVSSSSDDELDEAREKYGPEYDEKSVWVAYDLNGEKAGLYKTKTELFETATGEEADFDEEVELSGVLKLATVIKKPFSYTDSNGELTGADIEIAREIAKELNMDIEISSMSQDTAIRNTGGGKYDMAMAGFTTSVNGGNISFTDNYYGDHVIVLGKSGKMNGKICSALSKLKSNGTIKNIIEKYNIPASSEKPQEQVSTETTETTEATDNSTSTAIQYRVRKSANDSQTQLSAFASLENAKKDANAHKDEGYKVYDMSGNLVYTP